MTLTFSTSELAITRSSVFIRIAGREAFFNRPEGQPLGMFSRETTETAFKVWGLGFYVVVSRRVAGQCLGGSGNTQRAPGPGCRSCGASCPFVC